MTDPSAGWDAVADEFAAARSCVGATLIGDWARRLPPNAFVVDIGCGTGRPVTETLLAEGCRVSAIDASPRLVAIFRRNFPKVEVACEAAEESPFFCRTFDGAVATGLMFLLPDDAQARLIHRVGAALSAGGRFLFTSPRGPCCWTDSLTGRTSRSLGLGAYELLLKAAGFSLDGTFEDEGQNTYFDTIKALP